MNKCYIQWTDQNNKIHETKQYTNMIAALRASRTDAKRLGLEMKKVDGIEVRQIITTPIP